jgi:signal peptidase
MNLADPVATSILVELLATGRAAQFVVTGASMRPFLRGGETIVVRRTSPDQIRLGDLLLYRRETAGAGQLLLHRVVAVRRRPGLPALIQTHGDALWAPDEPVAEAQVLGRVCAVQRGPAPGRLVSLDTPGERLRAVGLALWLRGLWLMRAGRRAKLAEASWNGTPR